MSLLLYAVQKYVEEGESSLQKTQTYESTPPSKPEPYSFKDKLHESGNDNVVPASTSSASIAASALSSQQVNLTISEDLFLATTGLLRRTVRFRTEEGVFTAKVSLDKKVRREIILL